jgi:putative endonuclease
MSDQRKRTGAYGESIASDFLQEAGLHILARNWRRSGGELDIVAAEGETLVFIEVRTRSSRTYGSAEESVDWRKQRQVRKVAALYLAAEPVRYRQFRFDVVVVYLAGPTGAVQEIRHLRNAF